MAVGRQMVLTDSQHHAFAKDGVVHVPAAVEPSFVTEVCDLAERQLPYVTPGGVSTLGGRGGIEQPLRDQ